MTQYERIIMKERYEALHRHVAEMWHVAPPDERPRLESLEQEFMEQWQKYSGAPL